MTISTSASQITVAGTGSAYTFNFNFVGDSASDIVVSYINASGIQTILTPSQYSISLTAPAVNQLWGIGGTVTYPLTGPAIAVGTYLLIQRVLPLTQQVSIQNQGNFYAQVTEQALDIIEMQLQQIAARGGAYRGVWATGILYNFGDVVQDGANGNNTQNYYMCANPNTSGTWSTDLANGDWVLVINTQQILAAASAAAASATAAASSASSASTSASSASTSATTAATAATNASNSATAAAGSATSASTSATNASNSATAAAGSATSASTSATNAASSATSAAGSASTATTQAGIATTQAGNASTSASNAATSATNAAASAVNAGSTFTATSTTSNTIGTGNFTFTTQANKNFIAGQPIIAVSQANSANYIHGVVNSYSGTTLVITEMDNGGSGAHADWNIAVTGTPGPAGTGNINSGTSGQLAYYAGTGTTISGDPNVTTSGGALTAGVAGTTQGSFVAAGSVSGATTFTGPTSGGGTVTAPMGSGTILYAATAAATYETQSAAALLAPLASPTFTGIPAAPTAAYGTSTTQLATTAFVGLPFRTQHRQIFTTSGTYTPSANALYIQIEMVGGGGGGGGANASPGAGGGGGAGSYSRTWTTPAVTTITIGAGGTGNPTATGSTGGTTSYGTLTCPGGAGGLGSGTPGGVLGGPGGAASGIGDVTIGGSAGCNGFLTSSSGQSVGGNGGPSFFGGAGQGGFNNNGGTSATGYGSGGGGNAGSSAAAGSGANGIVIITEFCGS